MPSSTDKPDDKDTVIFIATESQVPTSEKPEKPEKPEEAFNEETGEINWDCPCIAPMVKPPCGEIFKEAFACFVYSKEEPKGVDCVEQFRAMQECFRMHPDIYGDELGDDEDDEDEDKSKDEEKKDGEVKDENNSIHDKEETTNDPHTEQKPESLETKA